MQTHIGMALPIPIRILPQSETGRPLGKLPTKKYPEDAGWDLYSTINITVPPGHRVLVPTGLAMAIPVGYYGRIAERGSSGSAGLGGGCGVVDCTFRGEIFIAVYNRAFFDDQQLTFPFVPGPPTNAPLIITPEKPIAQIIFERCDFFNWQIVNELPATARGSGMLGSTNQG